MTLTAIIPARLGSKGIPGKNLMLLAGKPMIQYTIETALACPDIDTIVLTTDDPGVVALGTRLGIIDFCERPPVLATDDASMFDVIEHTLLWLRDRYGQLPDSTVLLQPPSPLRSVTDLTEAIRLFHDRQLNSVVSVHEMQNHPCNCIHIDGLRWGYLVEPPEGSVRRQDYPSNYYCINGAIYLANTDYLLKTRGFLSSNNQEWFVMSRLRGIDVDSMDDLLVAEALLSRTTLDAENTVDG